MLTLINNQHFGRSPPFESGFARSYAPDLLIEIVLAWRDRSPRMDCHTCRTRRNRVRGRSILGHRCRNRLQVHTGRRRLKNAPPMFEAAIPVLAVTETTAGFFACFFLRAAMIARSSSDFPVPSRRKREIREGTREKHGRWHECR